MKVIKHGKNTQFIYIKGFVNVIKIVLITSVV